MNALDTNLVVRILVDDHPGQARRARAAAEAGGFVSKTVILETVWVLESVYGLKRDLVMRALLDFAALPGIEIEDGAGLAQAIRLVQTGFEFEDAYHFAGARHADALLTFDRSFVRRAARAGLRPEVKVP